MSELQQNLRILRPVIKGLPIIVVCFVTAMVLASRYLRYATPLYESTAKLKLADDNDGPASTSLYKDFDVFANSNKIGAEVELLKSKLLIGKALKKLDFDISIYRVGNIKKKEIYNESPITIRLELKNEKWFERSFGLTVLNKKDFILTSPDGKKIKASFGQLVQAEGFKALLCLNQPLLNGKPYIRIKDQYEFIKHDEEKLVNAVIGGLDVTSTDKEVPVLRISYQNAVPAKASALVNALAETYIDDYIEIKFKSANTTVNFIDNQLEDVSTNLAQTEDTIQNFRNQHNIINIRQETETDLRKIAEMKIQLSNLEMNLTAINELYAYVKKGQYDPLELAPNFEAFNDLLSTEIVKKIKQLQGEKKDLLTRYTPEEETVKVIDEKLKDLTSYLLEGIKNTRDNLAIKYREIDKNIREAEAVFRGLPEREKKMTILERNFTLTQKNYNFLREKNTEAQIARAAKTAFHRIISEGEVPERPVSPNSTLIKVVSGFLGLMTGFLIIFMMSTIKASVNDAYTITKNSSTPVALTIPNLKNHLEREHYFRQVAIKLELKGFLKNGNKVVISSFTDRECKNFFFDGLSEALIRLNKKFVIANEIENFMETLVGLRDRQLVLVDNLPLEKDSLALMQMAEADINLFVVDAIATPASRIEELDLLIEEYRLPNVYFCINRDAYSPGLTTFLWKKLRPLVLKISKHIKNDNHVRGIKEKQI